MERIKQAIEKVKAQQSKEGARNDLTHHRTSAGVSAPGVTRPDNELENFSYINTRVVEMDEVQLKSNRIVSFSKNDPMSMSFDLLRTHILQKMEDNNWRTLAITSPTPESGKTVVAINLAMSIAQQTNRTAMLVDFDLRRPKVGSYLGLHMEKSLNDLLEGASDIPSALVNPGIPRLVVLPTKNSVRKSSETLSSKQVANLIKELRERYSSRIVIFDLPPVLVADDVMALMPHIDCVLMVVANGMSTKREIEDSLRIIPASKLIGTILNKAETEPVPYYYD
jgi:protein-tyrosine kinase